MKVPIQFIFFSLLLLLVCLNNSINAQKTHLTIRIDQPGPLNIRDTSIVDATCPDLNDGSIDIISSGGTTPYSYKWSIDRNGSFIEKLYPGVYTVQITDNHNCSVKDSFQIEAKRESCLKPITAFTPNGDGKNDVWNIPGIKKKFPEAEVYIYNRRGDLLHKADASDSGSPEGIWDGRHNGELLPTDTYHYIIINDDKVIKKGHVTLLGDK